MRLYRYKLKKNIIDNFESENLDFNEVIKNFIKIKYQLLLWMKLFLYKIVELLNFIIYKLIFMVIKFTLY